MPDELYTQPSPEEIRALLKKYELTGSRAGQLVGVGSRAVRRWTGGERPMPWAAWTLLRLLTGDTTVVDVMTRIGSGEST
jgi:DNA-binding transcriptional regulator YiaG